jgi:hypothetical protein
MPPADALSYRRSRHFLSWSKGDRELIERRLGKIILDPGPVGQPKLNAESELWSLQIRSWRCAGDGRFLDL